MRRYDLLKTMERIGKTVGGAMTGQNDAPTIVQPTQYCTRFKSAMDKYFMAVPDKWSFSSDDQRRQKQQQQKQQQQQQQRDGGQASPSKVTATKQG